MLTVEREASALISPFYLVDEATDMANWLREGAPAEAAQKIVDCVEWTSSYPLRRVKKHRRIEAICPMVGPSLADQSLYFAAAFLSSREPSLEELDEVLRCSADRFDREIIASDPRLRCLTLVLPGVRGARLLEATEPERSIKGELLKRGILVGEFFPSCPFATTFNPGLFALRSPAPMYVFRTFLESDWRFLCRIPAWQKIYRERFGDPPRHLRHLGGRAWRLKQKVKWRVDALFNRITPAKSESSFFEP
jgi:hypothetical protein